MPYISTEQVKIIRQAIKKEFPNVKFSVTKEHCMSLNICIMESDIRFTAYDRRTRETYEAKQINPYYFDEHFEHNEIAKTFINRLLNLIDEIHPQKTISEDSDYGSIPNYYLNIGVGKWDKPYILKQAA